MSITLRKDKLDEGIQSGAYDEWLCHKQCGQFWSSCTCCTPELGFLHSEDAVETFQPIAGSFTGVDIDDLAITREWAGVGLIIGTNRDADTLTESNWECVYRDVIKEFNPYFSSVIRVSSWACGWIDYLVFNTANKELREFSESLAKSLADYPVYDESDFFEREAELEEGGE